MRAARVDSEDMANDAGGKQIVIIGCGPAGLVVANGLAGASAARKVQVTFLEKKDHVDLCVPQPRSLVNGPFASETLMVHDRALAGAGKLKPKLVNVADILSVGDGSIAFTTRDGQQATLRADAIVIATGSSYKGEFIKNNAGLLKDEWLQKMATFREAAGRARHILIIGGGPTGVELAGELATEHPTCKVTIVTKGQTLANFDAKGHKAALAGLKTLPGTVQVLTGDSVTAEEALVCSPPKTLVTANGVTLPDVDMVIQCAGVTPNTGFIAADKLNASKFLVVDDTLQVPTLTSAQCPVFAVGDVTHCGWGRFMVAEAMAKACVKNIFNLANGKPFKKVYDTNKKPFLPVIMTLGRKQGVASVPWANNWLGRWLKAPAMITPMLWGNLGVKGFVLSAAAKGPSPITTPA